MNGSQPRRLPAVPSGTKHFFGRRDKLADLENFFQSNPSGAVVAVHGLPGVGKTQFALKFAETHKESYSFRFFIGADSRAALDRDFAEIGRGLGLPVANWDKAEPADIAKAVIRWMEAESGWLAIFDNADNLDLVKEYLPAEGKGQILLTTRASDARLLSPAAFSIGLTIFSEDEGTEFLLKETGKDDAESAREITRAVGGLPLALDQAFAYVVGTPCTLAEYLESYRAEGKELRARRGSYRTDHESVAVTFALAFKPIAEKHPATADILRVCAFCASDDIPEEIFLESGDTLGEAIASVAGSQVKWRDALNPATKFSLLARDGESKTLGLHRLIQAVIKDEMLGVEQRQWAERLVSALATIFPEVKFENWPQCWRILPHCRQAAALIEQFQLENGLAAKLLDRTGEFLADQVKFSESALLLKRGLEIRERVFGPDHPKIAESLNNLAELHHSQGRYAEAVPLFERALEVREHALGVDHPDTALSLNNLAVLFQSQGRYAEAEPLYERALGIRERALGSAHPDTGESLNNLASLYQSQGRYAEAESLFERALGIAERALGSEHPFTGASFNNLAGLYQGQGRYAEAEPLFERALGIAERALGSEHPFTGASFNNLAGLYQAQGRYTEAEPLYERALGIRERALGSEHPDRASSLNNLAGLYRAQGRYKEAEPLYERALGIRERALGSEHSSTASSLNNLARVCLKLGKPRKAEELLSLAVRIFRKTLGEQHPNTQNALRGLEDVRRQNSRFTHGVKKKPKKKR